MNRDFEPHYDIIDYLDELESDYTTTSESDQEPVLYYEEEEIDIPPPLEDIPISPILPLPERARPMRIRDLSRRYYYES